MTARRRFGSVRELPSGRWQARYRDNTGRMRSAPETFKSERAAEKWLAVVETDLLRGQWHDPKAGRITFAEWIDDYTAGALHKRPTTVAKDRSTIKCHLRPAFGRMPLASITPLDIRQFVTKLNADLGPGTVRSVYGTLRAILRAAVDADLIAVSPCRGVKLPAKPRTEIRVITPEELARLAEAIPRRYRPMPYLAGVLGLRWSEVAGLRVGRLDLLRRRLTVAETAAQVGGFSPPKTEAARRTIDIPPFLAELLAEHLAEQNLTGADATALVFTSPRGGRLYAANWWKVAWAPTLKKVGLDGLRFHDLRHSSVALAIAMGAHARQIQERLGHSSIVTTMDTYGHVLSQTNDDLTAKLDIAFTVPAQTKNIASSGTSVARPRSSKRLTR